MKTGYAPPAVQEAVIRAQSGVPLPEPLSRKAVRQTARTERCNRAIAIDQARRLAMSLYHRTAIEGRSFTIGLALERGETVWAETWVRCSLDRPAWQVDPSRLPLSAWLATNHRIVGRLTTGQLVGWGWGDIVGCRADLTARKEWAQIDPKDSPPVVWHGPGVAPLAVALVAQVHGIVALLEHPGLAPLRVTAKPGKRQPGPMLALPRHNEIDDLLHGL